MEDTHEVALVAAVALVGQSADGIKAFPHNGAIEQMVTVAVREPTSTTARLSGWGRGNDGWRREIGPFEAFVGAEGIGEAKEGLSRTPVGVYALTEAFGIEPNNGTRLPYFKVDEQDWWVSDVNSPEYNKRFRCPPGKCPFNERAGERLISAGAVYNHAVVIDYNRNPVTAGAGSAFFLHVSDGKPTAGCVSVAQDDLNAVMRWLDPARKPAISIG